MPDDVSSRHPSGEMMPFFRKLSSRHLDGAEKRCRPDQPGVLRIEALLHQDHGHQILTGVQDITYVDPSLSRCRAYVDEIGGVVPFQTFIRLKDVWLSLPGDRSAFPVQEMQGDLLPAVHDQVEMPSSQLITESHLVLTQTCKLFFLLHDACLLMSSEILRISGRLIGRIP